MAPSCAHALAAQCLQRPMSGMQHVRGALNDLCGIYWQPLYAYIRRGGSQPAEAEDLIQGFFARLLEKSDLADVDRAKGKFRSFLLASLKLLFGQ